MSAAADTSENRRLKQPIEALQLPDALLRLDTLAAACGLSISTLYRKAAEGQLELVRIGTRCTRVRASSARDFIRAQGGDQ